MTFFGQPPSNRAAIHEELFNIAYYGNGFNHNDLYNMPVPLRRFYAQKLVEAKEKEAAADREMQQMSGDLIDPMRQNADYVDLRIIEGIDLGYWLDQKRNRNKERNR